MRIVWIVLVVIATTGCWRVTVFPDADPIEEPDVDEVVIFGMIRFDPPIERRRPFALFRSQKRHFQARVYLSDTPIPLDKTFTGTNEAFFTDAGVPFARVAVRRSRYLQGIVYFYGSRGAGSTYEHIEMMCNLPMFLEVLPEDRYVYAGEVVCRHRDGRPYEMEVVDNLEAMRPFWSEYTGGEWPEVRLLEPLTTVAPGSPVW